MEKVQDETWNKTLDNATIAHEIRNPLTTVKGFLQLIRPHLTTIGKQHYADLAIEEINRANNLLYEHLHPNVKHKNAITTITLQTLIKEMAMIYESEAQLKGIQILTKTSCKDVVIHESPDLLKKVIGNLLKNALEAIDSSQKSEKLIILTTSTSDNQAVIEIMDTGCGIPGTKLQQIFSSYYTSKQEGTGIGLYICRTIMEQLGGTIEVTSDVELGTTFKLLLPIKP